MVTHSTPRAEQFFGGKVDVLVNNAGVSPLVCNFDTVMKVRMGLSKSYKVSGEPGGRAARCKHDGGETEHGVGGCRGPGGEHGVPRRAHPRHGQEEVGSKARCAVLTLPSSISYQISKHGVVALTRSFGGPKVANKTGIKVAVFSRKESSLFPQHVALCPWFAETGIMEGVDKERLKKAVMFDFVTVERVGEAFEQVVRDQHSGSLMMIMSGCPLTYYPDITNALFMLTVLLSRWEE